MIVRFSPCRNRGLGCMLRPHPNFDDVGAINNGWRGPSVAATFGPRHDVKVGEEIENDEAVGSWSRLDYETMDTRFRLALARAMKRGQ
jgi:hypothetical protein